MPVNLKGIFATRILACLMKIGMLKSGTQAGPQICLPRPSGEMHS